MTRDTTPCAWPPKGFASPPREKKRRDSRPSAALGPASERAPAPRRAEPRPRLRLPRARGTRRPPLLCPAQRGTFVVRRIVAVVAFALRAICRQHG